MMNRYHDEEWGRPVHDDDLLFEFLVLDGAQAGLSWMTILRKREAYREAFDGFDPAKVAVYDEEKLHMLMSNPGIVRNRQKIRAAIVNARVVQEIQAEHGSFDRYLWGFVAGRTIQNRWRSFSEIPSETIESKNMSLALKKRGFQFVGPTVCYAFMQSVGMVNDHLVGCFRHRELERRFDRPLDCADRSNRA